MADPDTTITYCTYQDNFPDDHLMLPIVKLAKGQPLPYPAVVLTFDGAAYHAEMHFADGDIIRCPPLSGQG